jgi:hypothetical protein
MSKLGLSAFFAVILMMAPGKPRAAGARAAINVGCDPASLIQAINDANGRTGDYAGPDTLELSEGCVYTLREAGDGPRDNLMTGLPSMVTGHLWKTATQRGERS